MHKMTPPPSPAPCSVSLLAQTSQASCVAGLSFGCDDQLNRSNAETSGREVWTKEGCAGRFVCGTQAVVCPEPYHGRPSPRCPCEVCNPC